MPLFRKFPEIRKFQIEIKNFRKNETVSLDKNNWSKRGERFGEMENVSNSLIKDQNGNLFHLSVQSGILVQLLSTSSCGDCKVQEIWDSTCVISV